MQSYGAFPALIVLLCNLAYLTSTQHNGPNPMDLKPRLIVELQSDGSLSVETIINGARLQEPLTDGYEITTIRQILGDMRRSIEAEAARKAALREEEENRRHRRVWRNVAYGIDGSRGHGASFADKTVGKMRSAQTLKPDTVLATEDLL